jgi:hypothetical protein
MRLETLNFGPPVFVLLLVAGLSFALVAWHYRSSNPPVKKRLRIALASLRTAALLCLLLAFADPAIQWVRTQRVRPLVGVFLDASRSMAVSDGGAPRTSVMTQWWRRVADDLREHARLSTHAFGVHVRRVSPQDTIPSTEEGTDLSVPFRFALDSLRQESPAAILILTDGRHTFGPDPLRWAVRSPCPVFIAVIGDTAQAPDMAVLDASAPEVAYAGKPFPVRLGVRKIGGMAYGGEIRVTEDGATLVGRPLRLEAAESEWWGTLEVVVSKPGVVHLRAEVTPAAGEVNVENNGAGLFVRVLPARKKVLLAAREPGPDFGFLRRSLAVDSTVDLAVACFLGRRWLVEDPSGMMAGEADLVIFLDLPSRLVQRNGTWERLRQAANRSRRLLIFAGPQFDPETARQLFSAGSQEFVRRGQATTVYCFPATGAEFHPLVRFSDFEAETRQAWQQLPPVMWWGWAFQSGGKVVLVGRAATGDTVAVASVAEVAGHEVALFSITGFWRWGLTPLAFAKDVELFRSFVRNVTNWPYSSSGSELLRVETARSVFDGTEPIRFRAFAQDEAHNPVRQARVSLEVHGRQTDLRMELEPVADGVYEGSIPALPEGRYRFRAVASVGERELGSSEGEFAVRGYTPELSDPRASAELAEGIARATGGIARLYAEAQQVVDSLEAWLRSPRWANLTAERRFTWNAQESLWMLGIAGFALVLEWVLRRRNGLL